MNLHSLFKPSERTWVKPSHFGPLLWPQPQQHHRLAYLNRRLARTPRTPWCREGEPAGNPACHPEDRGWHMQGRKWRPPLMGARLFSETVMSMARSMQHFQELQKIKCFTESMLSSVVLPFWCSWAALSPVFKSYIYELNVLTGLTLYVVMKLRFHVYLHCTHFCTDIDLLIYHFSGCFAFL